MSSRFIHVVTNIRISLLFKTPLYVYTTFCLSIHLILGLLQSFGNYELCCYEHGCANTSVFWILFSEFLNSVRYTEVALLSHVRITFLILGKLSYSFHGSCTILYFYQQCTRVPISLQGDSTFYTISVSPHLGLHLLLCFLINCKNPILHTSVYLWTIF